MATSYRKAEAVHTALEATKWNLFDAVAALTDERAAAAAGHRSQLVEALSHDEYAIALGERLRKLEDDAVRLLAPPPTKPPTPGKQVVETKSHQNLAASAAQDILDELGSRLKADAELRLDVSWTLTKTASETPEKK